MQLNVGTVDRVARVATGLALIVAASAQALGPWAWIGIVPLVTGVVGSCPLYAVLGIDTCRVPPG